MNAFCDSCESAVTVRKMGPPRLKISSTVIDRIKDVKTKASGCLFGIIYDNTLLVVGFNLEQNIQNISAVNLEEWTKITHSCVLRNLPTEIDLCGLITFEEDIDDKETHGAVINMLEDVTITDNPLLLSCQTKDGSSIKTHFYVHEKLLEENYEVVSEVDMWKEFVHVRLQGRLPLICELDATEVKDNLRSLHKKVAAGMLTFSFQKSSVYLMGSDPDSGLSGLSGEPSVGELWDRLVGCNDLTEGCNPRSKKKASSNTWEVNVLPVNLLIKPTNDIRTEGQPKSAPVIQHIKKTFNCLKMAIHVDALSMVSRKTKVLDLYAILVESACRNISLSEDSLVEQLSHAESTDDFVPSMPQPFHFLAAHLGHFITLMYPKNESDEDLYKIRDGLHGELGLSRDRPYFRRGNAHIFSEDLHANSPLMNPHEGLGPSGVRDGEVSIVKGIYSYHHYMQDRMDDNGWGCAYRSLQTLVSWFRLQGYTEHPIPTHREIQQCLVNLKDKTPSFIGSTQWIGSTEVYMCLESMLGVTSRIISVSSGEELGSKGGELAFHFKTQGTPIMIGGGVLAHTILGVDFNKNTGDLKFLILDPHYTGGEDLSVIQNKGWCGWKGINFWAKNAYYNLCLPQASKCI